MHFLRATVLTLIIIVASFSVASAAPGQATKAEAKAFVEKGAAYIKLHGKEKALAEFNNPKGKFVDRDLYMFAYDFNGVNLALGSNPKWVGHNFLDLDDADGTAGPIDGRRERESSGGAIIDEFDRMTGKVRIVGVKLDFAFRFGQSKQQQSVVDGDFRETEKVNCGR